MRFAPSVLVALIAVTAAPVVEAATNLDTGNYRIDAVAEPGAAPIWDAAKVVVRDAGGDIVARRHAVPAVVDLPEEDGYTATVIYKESAGRATLSLEGTKVNLRAGEATLELVSEGNSGRAATQPQLWYIYRYKSGQGGGNLVARTRDARPVLTLSAGWYEVRAEHAGGTTHHVIEVKAGRRFDYRIVADGP